MSQPRYDLVVYGATSFVGQILVDYLASQYGAGGKLKWAIAGRSRERLERVRESLNAAGEGLDLLVADAADEAALEQLCNSTRAVVSTVGPYALYGETLVRVCARTGTDYCDLTGEVQWIRRMIERYEDHAKRSGARIVHCCGFDSIPSDMGVHFLQQAAQTRWGSPASRVKMRVHAIRGGMSGGTVASMVNAVREATRDREVRREMADPYSLCPPDHGFSVRQPNVNRPVRDEEFQAWAGPFIMAAINTRVVMRSNALSGAAWGRDFRYDEGMLLGSGWKARLGAWGMSLGLGLFVAAVALPPTRWLLARFVLPKPGEGPGPEARERGFYDLRFAGHGPEDALIRTRVTGDMDPGYGSTAKMLGEAAVCLALDVPQMDRPGGFWTPSTCFGERLRERLEQHAGLKFEVLD